LKRFLFEHVESYEDLGVLVWFHRRSGASGTAARIAADAGLPEASVEEAIEKLSARGLLSRSAEQDAAFHYTPADAAIREVLNRVMDLYENNAVEIVGFMTANAIERVRTAGTRMFAECFRIGGPKSRG
jgi:DNA-binding MarR family transcriptional regulator